MRRTLVIPAPTSNPGHLSTPNGAVYNSPDSQESSCNELKNPLLLDLSDDMAYAQRSYGVVMLRESSTRREWPHMLGNRNIPGDGLKPTGGRQTRTDRTAREKKVQATRGAHMFERESRATKCVRHWTFSCVFHLADTTRKSLSAGFICLFYTCFFGINTLG